MIHAILVNEPSILQAVVESFDAKNIPSEDSRHEAYKHGNIFVIGWFSSADIRIVLQSTLEQYIPDTVFLLNPAHAVSDEKRVGDIVLPNVFFQYDNALDTYEIDEENRDTFLKRALFIEHYDKQNDYDFESFGLSVGGINVSGKLTAHQDMDEDFRIKLRLAYEADTFDADTFTFVEEMQKLDVGEKAYPVEMIVGENIFEVAGNAVHIVRFFIASMEEEWSVSEEEPEENDDKNEDDDWK